ncbi:MAG: hypothetical protein KatS3mg027_1971 [Bacteroidia bacterium]|nr:MAG: hypothetical protein KatS3mg027_1971 [Bacteroidia bacterium]
MTCDLLSPIDEEILHEVCNKYSTIITIEDGTIIGGLGSAVLEFMADNNYKNDLIRMGIPDQFIEHGEPMELYEECGISPNKNCRKNIGNYSKESAFKILF